MDYEDGVRSPSGIKAKSFSFIADASVQNEGFNKYNEELEVTLIESRLGLPIHKIEKVSGMSESDLKNNIISTFDSSPLFITYFYL